MRDGALAIGRVALTTGLAVGLFLWLACGDGALNVAAILVASAAAGMAASNLLAAVIGDTPVLRLYRLFKGGIGLAFVLLYAGRVTGGLAWLAGALGIADTDLSSMLTRALLLPLFILTAADPLLGGRHEP